MKLVNGINIEAVMKKVSEVMAKPHFTAKVRISVQSTWNFNPEGARFRGTAITEKGEFTIEADEPTFLGGRAEAPNPVQILLLGGIACYSATFAKACAMVGAQLKSMSVNADTILDLRRPMGIEDIDTIKEVTWEVFVETDATDEQLEKARELANHRCPGHFVFSQPVKVNTKISRI